MTSTLWSRLQDRHTRTGEKSEAPESGIDVHDEKPLFPLEQPLEGPEHPGQLIRHYRMDSQHPGHSTGFPPPPVPVPPVPKGNKFYDVFRTQQIVANNAIEYFASGSISAPAAGASTAIAITTMQPAIHLRLLELPWTLQAYVIVRRFSAVPLTVADTGAITWFYLDRGGVQSLLNAGDAKTSCNHDPNILTVTPITDATPGDLGQLMISAGSGGTYAATWLWYMNFSFLYLRPGDLTK